MGVDNNVKRATRDKTSGERGGDDVFIRNVTGGEAHTVRA